MLVSCLLNESWAQSIVDVSSKLLFREGNSTDVNKTVKLVSLWMYQDLVNYQANLTINSTQLIDSHFNSIPGKMLFCYVYETEAIDSFQKFKDSCRDSYNNTDNSTVGWTIVSNADIRPDNNLELLKLISNYENKTQIQGLIMISDNNPSPLDDS